MRHISRYKDYDKLAVDLRRERNLAIEAVPVDWSSLPFPDAPPLKRKRSPPRNVNFECASATTETMTKAEHKNYEKEAAARRKASWAHFKRRGNPLGRATAANENNNMPWVKR
jgi:hypothetical protein